MLAQVWNKFGNETPDIDAETLKSYVLFMLELHQEGLLLAYHDRADGGLYTTLMEMAFASHCGFKVNLFKLCENVEEAHRVLFSEELGSVLQVRSQDEQRVLEIARKY